MDETAAATRARDEEWGAVADQAAAARAQALLLDLHTCLPGIVRSFDEATQTVTVQAALKRQFIVEEGDGWVEIPLMVDVPVLVYGGGDLYLTFPIKPGDECLLHFSERAYDFWWDRGGVQEPSEYRLHDYSDAFAVVGPLSRPRMLSSYSTDAAELRTRGGTTLVRVKDGQIDHVADTVNVGADAGTQATIMGETYRSSEDAYFNAVNAAISAIETALAGLGATGASAAVAAVATAAGVFSGAASTYLTTKAKVL